MTEQPKTLPLAKENFCLRLLCCWLMYERQRDSELRLLAEGLIIHFHSSWHKDHGDDWRACHNEKCVNARLIIDASRQAEIDLNQFAIDLMSRYTINFRPVAQDGQLLKITAKLVEISELVKAAENSDPTKQTGEGVILP